MDKEIRGDVQKAKEEIHKRTGVSSTRLRQKKMRMEVDTSNYTMGEILSIECKNGK